MGVSKRIIAEGGSGGGRGHSSMEHWMKTAEIKAGARVVRRKINRDKIGDGLSEYFGSTQTIKGCLPGDLVPDVMPEVD